MYQRIRHGKAQIVPLPVLEGNQKSDPRDIKEMGAKSRDIKERVEMTKRNHDASAE